MIFDFFEGIWHLFLFCIFVLFPFLMLIGFLQKREELKNEFEVETKSNKKNDSQSYKPEASTYEPPIETYKTVKKEPGSYAVVGPDNMEAIVIRVETPHDGKYWIAILPLKEAKKSERVKTKKEAVALAIELLKEHKESKNGS